MEFSGKTAIITGASGGIGLAIAMAMSDRGVNVVLAARNTQALTTACQAIQQAGPQALAIQCDVGNDADVVSLVEKALNYFGKVDILVNNAGVAVRGLLENMTMPDWEYIINTNLLGYIRNVQALLPHFLARGSGYIINIASIQALGKTGDILNIPYITTKSGIMGFSESLYGYLRPKGIKVACLVPGGVSTNMGINARFIGSEKEQQDMKIKEEKFFKMPFFMKPELLAEALVQGMQEGKYLILVPPDMAAHCSNRDRIRKS
jgi:NAD(P)-dependent dehydrogenase (short-subunit alcohol dehydrogenase family)